MLISELIKLLESIQKERGDLPVTVFDNNPHKFLNVEVASVVTSDNRKVVCLY